MSTQRLNAAEKDLEKFIKFLAFKSSQVVVQSRLGEKIQTQCVPLAGNDWFNIAIEDHPDILDETKRALSLNPGDSVLDRLPLCIEISLKTVEGDQMVLEVWSLDLLQAANSLLIGVGAGTKDDKISAASVGGISGNSNVSQLNTQTDGQTLRAAHAIYNRMGIMLKSLISLTRATPAYKLSRRQCPESYGIYYRIYVGRPQVHTLGEGHKNVKIGQLSTIVGSLIMSVAYRTKMTITPTATQRNTETNTMMLKSDHFRPAEIGSPISQHKLAKKNNLNGAVGDGERKMVDIDKPLRPGAFTDVAKLRQFTKEEYVLPEIPPFEWILRRARHESTGSESIESLNNRKCESPCNGQLLLNNNNNNANLNNLNHNNNNTNTNNNNNNSTTFKSFEKPANIVAENKSQTVPAHSSSPIKGLLIPAPIRTSPVVVTQPPDDDNLLKELNFPFASPTSHVNDLAKFYRDCYHAPPLRGLSELQDETISTTTTTPTTLSTTSLSTTPNAGVPIGIIGGCGAEAATVMANSNAADNSVVDDLSRQLELFETSLADYDKLVSQLGLTASSSTGSRSSGGGGLQMSN